MLISVNGSTTMNEPKNKYVYIFHGNLSPIVQAKNP